MQHNSNVCPGCGNRDSHIYLDRCLDLLYRMPGEWDLLECESCQLIYTIPPLNSEDLLKYYPVAYRAYQLPQPVRSNPIGALLRSLAMLPYRLKFGDPDWEMPPFGAGRFLDIGCGSGVKLKQMAALGWNCSGFDVNPTAVQQAQQTASEAYVFVSTLDDLDTSQTFDLVSMSHVLEHLPDPATALRKCYRLLSPSGKLVISIPNIGSLEARWFGRAWIGLDVPRHLVHFREPVICQLLAKCDFTILRVRPAMWGLSFSDSLVIALPEAIRYRLLGSRAMRLLYFLMVFPASLSYALGNRGIIEIVAQKSE
jgi:SAM-dependent methyltransferase